MIRKSSAVLIAFICLSTFVHADKKHRDWKTGKVLNTDSSDFTTTTTQGRINPDGTYSSNTTPATENHRKYVLAIESDENIYVVSHVLSWNGSKAVQVTINGPVKYAVEKKNFYLLDENNREFKMKIEKKILKEKKNP